MIMSDRLGNRWTSLALAALCLMIGAGGGWWWQARHIGGADKVAIETVVHDYLLEHPEILPAAEVTVARYFENDDPNPPRIPAGIEVVRRKMAPPKAP